MSETPEMAALRKWHEERFATVTTELIIAPDEGESVHGAMDEDGNIHWVPIPKDED